MITGEKLRDDGVAQVLDNENEAWKAEAREVIEQLIAEGNPFTSEDLTARMTIEPHHPNAVGGFWIHAIKRYDLQVQGYRKASRPSARAHVLPIWLSNRKGI